MGALGPLVSLLRDGDAAGRVSAAEALQGVGSLAENRVLIVEGGAVGPLVSLLRDGDAAERGAAAGALAKLCSASVSIRASILLAGALEPLQALSDSELLGSDSARRAIAHLSAIIPHV